MDQNDQGAPTPPLPNHPPTPAWPPLVQTPFQGLPPYVTPLVPPVYASPLGQPAYAPPPPVYAPPPPVWVLPNGQVAPVSPAAFTPLPVPTPAPAAVPGPQAQAAKKPSSSELKSIGRTSSTRLRATSSAAQRALKPETADAKESRIVRSLVGLAVSALLAGLALLAVSGGREPEPAQVVAVEDRPTPRPVVVSAAPTPSPAPSASPATALEAKQEPKDDPSFDALDRAAASSREPDAERAKEPEATSSVAPRQKAPEASSDPAPAARPSPLPRPEATALAQPAPKPQPQGPHEVVEQFDSGKPKARYRVDKDGRKDGSFVSYHENGKVASRATYKADVIVGEAEDFWPNGTRRSKRSYKKGVLHGRAVEFDEKGRPTSDLVFVDGHLSYTKTPEQIARTLAAIERADFGLPAGKPTCDDVQLLDADQQVKALKRLLAYRALCDVPTDVTLDFGEAERAAAGAKLLTFIGRLDHTPAKPAGVPDLLYQLGYDGTSHGNLYEGDGDLLAAVDCWIDDSDHENGAIVGHRRWALDPAMRHVAFGRAKHFCVMYAHDGRDKQASEVPDGVISWPPRGYCPTNLFRHGVSWSVSLDPRRYGRMPSDVKIRVQTADASFRKVGEREVKDVNVNREPYGAFSQCVTFKVDAPTGPGDRYWVSLEGVKDASGAPADVEYLVEFYRP